MADDAYKFNLTYTFKIKPITAKFKLTYIRPYGQGGKTLTESDFTIDNDTLVRTESIKTNYNTLALTLIDTASNEIYKDSDNNYWFDYDYKINNETQEFNITLSEPKTEPSFSFNDKKVTDCNIKDKAITSLYINDKLIWKKSSLQFNLLHKIDFTPTLYKISANDKVIYEYNKSLNNLPLDTTSLIGKFDANTTIKVNIEDSTGNVDPFGNVTMNNEIPSSSDGSDGGAIETPGGMSGQIGDNSTFSLVGNCYIYMTGMF